MIWILFAMFCAMGCNRCRKGRCGRRSDLIPMVLMFIILVRFAGHGPWIPILACVAIGYFLRKIEQTRGEDWFGGNVTDEDLEEGLEEE